MVVVKSAGSSSTSSSPRGRANSGDRAVDVGPPPDEHADASIRNLCDNAGRYAVGTVILTLAEQDGAALLTVADDGPGIPSDQVDFVFERFGRLDDSRTQATGGAGLGLAITREIIEAHHGTIEIDKSHEPGACFVVTLPLG